MHEQDPDRDATSAPSIPPTELATGQAPVQPPVTDPPGGRRFGRTPAVVAGVAALVLIAATAAFGYSLDRDLAATRSTLATTTSNLATTRGSLSSTSTTLDETTATLAAAARDREGLEMTVTELSAQV